MVQIQPKTLLLKPGIITEMNVQKEGCAKRDTTDTNFAKAKTNFTVASQLF